MAKSDNNLKAVFEDTANAIRSKTGSNGLIEPRDFADEIESIQTGIEPTGTIEITTNGEHDVAQYGTANVNVPNPSTGTYNVNNDGTYDIKDYAEVNVRVVYAGTKSIYENRRLIDVYHYGSVNVEVPYTEVGNNFNLNSDITHLDPDCVIGHGNGFGDTSLYYDSYDITSSGITLSLHTKDSRPFIIVEYNDDGTIKEASFPGGTMPMPMQSYNDHTYFLLDFVPGQYMSTYNVRLDELEILVDKAPDKDISQLKYEVIEYINNNLYVNLNALEVYSVTGIPLAENISSEDFWWHIRSASSTDSGNYSY